ncbi:TBC domain-containing protein kinase protein [Biomphalaria glabrata]|nr:TBC domain-containing protein kinase protein [Biomphalaria glabrata]
MPALGSAEFGVRTFYAASHPNDKCGPNGLPLTPNSVKILGRFQYLTTLSHPRLCQYLDISKTKHECMIVISEHHKSSVKEKLNSGQGLSENAAVSLGFQILEGLTFLHEKNVVHRNLSMDNILIEKQGNIKLSEYGLYYMTDYGADVSFPIGLPHYMAPEVLCSGPLKVDEDSGQCIQPISGPKVDVWSFGIILLELLLGREVWSGLSLQETFVKLMLLIKSDMSPLDYLCQDASLSEKLKGTSKELKDLLRLCLTVSSSKRATSEEVKQHPIFRSSRENAVAHKREFDIFTAEVRSADLELPTYEETIANDFSDDHLSQRSMQEVYYLWRLAGGDLDGALRKAGMSKTRPPIHLLPCYGILDGDVFGQDRDNAELLNNTVITLSQEQLRFRLREIPATAYYPLLEDESKYLSENQLPASPSYSDLANSATLPLVIREKDVDYQFHRIILFERLLNAYPFKRPYIWREARVDIPPLVRAHVWAAILEVEGDLEGWYTSIDKETPTATDRQIEVDIPRCHQYHELLSSPTAHAKFKRVLKAWVLSNPQYVYWQGLDSLCAPFLALSFNSEALAFACLSAFIPKYLHKFFLRDNSAVIQEYLAVFSHLISFHDPELGNHLDGIGFIPDLYAIPWFLTMYAHVFPLHKIVHLWDTLLLGNSSFPLCIGVAILQQLRDRLLSFGFNECILLFSDMPEIDIERCVQDSIRIFCSTPKSATYRQHARPLKPKNSTDRPNVSYYSRDYHDQPQTDLSMEPIPLEELKSEKYPRISAEDLIELGELAGSANSRSPTKKRQNSKPMILILDVRHHEEYKRGTLQGSINIPFQTAFSPEGELNPCPAVQILNSRRNQVIVVVGNRGRFAANFANELVRLGYSRVCVLHKGIDIFRTTNLLIIPPADI